MTSSVGDITVRVGADTAELERNFKSAAGRVKDFVNKSKRSLKSYKKNLAGGTEAAGKLAASIAAVTGAVLAMQNASAKGAREIKNFSRVANETTDNFQALAFGARQYGIESDKLSDILKDVNDKVGDFQETGGGALADFFENIAPKVGVTADSFKNLSGSQSLQLYISSLEKANLSQSRMTFFMEAIASDATNLIPLFSKNGEEIKKMTEEAERLNVIISKSDLEKLAASNTQFSKMSDSIRAARDAVAILFLPELEKISTTIVNITSKFTNLIKSITMGSEESQKELEIREKINKVLGVTNKQESAIVGRRASRNRALKETSTLLTKEVQQATKVNDLLLQQEQLQSKLLETTKKVTVGQSRKRTITKKMNEEEKADHDALIKSQIEANELLIAQLVQQSDKAKEIFNIRKAAAEIVKSDAQGSPIETNSETEEQRKERLNMQAETELEAMRLLSESKALLKEQEYLTDEEMLMRHLEKLKNIEDLGRSAILNIIREKASLGASITAGSFLDILNTASTGSKKAFEISKKFAIADALVSTYQGIAAGVKLGWPLAIPAVAYASATGFQAISKIKSQSFSGGGGGGVSVSAPQQSAPAQQQGAGGQGQASATQTLQVAPIDPSAIFSGSAMQAIAEQVYNFSKDGGDVVFT